MTDLPKNGDKVRIYPFPGRKAHANERPVDAMGGGRFISDAGEEVAWSDFHLSQLRSGDILLHAPPAIELDPAAPKPAPSRLVPPPEEADAVAPDVAPAALEAPPLPPAPSRFSSKKHDTKSEG